MRNPGNDGDAPKVDYVERVNLVLDHVVRHLDGPLRLEELARVAGFSPFHFHRVFGALMGEPLGQFIKRVRLDRALFRYWRRPALLLWLAWLATAAVVGGRLAVLVGRLPS